MIRIFNRIISLIIIVTFLLANPIYAAQNLRVPIGDDLLEREYERLAIVLARKIDGEDYEYQAVTRLVGGFLALLNDEAEDETVELFGDEVDRDYALGFLRSVALAKSTAISYQGKARLQALANYSDIVLRNILSSGQLPVHVMAEIQKEIAKSPLEVLFTQAMMCPFDETITRAMAREAKALGFAPVFIMAPSQATLSREYVGKTPAEYKEMVVRIMHEEAPGIPYLEVRYAGNNIQLGGLKRFTQNTKNFIMVGCQVFKLREKK
tara:strand:- start:4 stop:801 length:798 start_codon:yes stop_codon:yes gene_type:complete